MRCPKWTRLHSSISRTHTQYTNAHKCEMRETLGKKSNCESSLFFSRNDAEHNTQILMVLFCFVCTGKAYSMKRLKPPSLERPLSTWGEVTLGLPRSDQGSHSGDYRWAVQKWCRAPQVPDTRLFQLETRLNQLLNITASKGNKCKVWWQGAALQTYYIGKRKKSNRALPSSADWCAGRQMWGSLNTTGENVYRFSLLGNQSIHIHFR